MLINIVMNNIHSQTENKDNKKPSCH